MKKLTFVYLDGTTAGRDDDFDDEPELRISFALPIDEQEFREGNDIFTNERKVKCKEVW